METNDNNNCALLEKVIIGEIQGKYAAIHSYDGIIWKIRTGYLTLLFAGWAIFLKSMADNAGKGVFASSDHTFRSIAFAMILFSVGLALGGRLIDSIYEKRKARVIFALDALIDSIAKCGKEYYNIPVKFLQVVGDNPEMPVRSEAYREAKNGSAYVFFVPLLTVIAAGICICWV